MSEEEDAALAALQGGNNETSETEPARESETSPPEEVAQEAGVEQSDSSVQPENGQAPDGDGPNGDAPSEPAKEAVEGEASGEPDVSAVATMDDVRRNEVDKDWVKTLTPRIPKGVFINDDGVMSITVDADDKELGDMVGMFSEADLRAGRMSIRCKLYMAETVYELASRNSVSPDQVIDELDLCNKTGRDYDTVYSWCRALAELPDGCFHPNLTMSHYVLSSRVTKPKGVKEMRKFNKKRIALLKEAAVDPDTMSARQIARELKQVTAALDKKEPDALKRESIGVIHDRLIDNYRVHRLVPTMPELLENNSITMADLVNQIEADECELINRHKIVEDAAQIVLHWTDNPTVDVTETKGEEDGTTQQSGGRKTEESESENQEDEGGEEAQSSSEEEE